MMEKKIELKLTKEISRPDILLSMARMPNSEVLQVGSSDFKLYGFDLSIETKEPISEGLAHESYVTGVTRTDDFLVTSSYDQRLVWWNLETGKPVRTIENAHQRFIRDVQASPDGKWIVSVGDDMIGRIWESRSGKLKHELHGQQLVTPSHYPSMLYACAVSPDSQNVATVDRIGTIFVWRIEDGQQIAKLEAPEMYTWDPKQRRHSIGGIRCVAFSPDGRHLAVGGIGQIGNVDHLDGKSRVEIFDWREGEKTHSYGDNSFKGMVESLAFHPNGDWLAAAGGDNSGFLMFFDLADSKKSFKDEKAPMHVHSIAVSEGGDAVYAVGHGKIAKWTVSA